MTKIQKIKNWTRDHSPAITTGVAIVALFGLSYGLVQLEEADAKDREKEAKKINKYIIEQNKLGKTVVQLADGTFIGVTYE